jgi:membrane-associated HD superfamily phosphohydrolase
VVEAATRSLREPNPAQLAELITRVVNQRIADGQLDSAP